MKIIDGIVIVDIDNKKVAICTGDAVSTFKGFINLNETAYEIWQCIEQGKNIEDIVSYLTQEYKELSYDNALKYTIEFINKLKEKGIVVE